MQAEIHRLETELLQEKRLSADLRARFWAIVRDHHARYPGHDGTIHTCAHNECAEARYTTDYEPPLRQR